MNATTVNNMRHRLFAAVVLAVGLMLMAGPAFAQEMPAGSGYECGDGTTSVTCYDTIADGMEVAVSDFTTLVVDLAPYLFGGLVSVLLIRLAMRWFGRVTKSV